jgi:hypothetical protein
MEVLLALVLPGVQIDTQAPMNHAKRIVRVGVIVGVILVKCTTFLGGKCSLESTISPSDQSNGTLEQSSDGRV